MSGHADGSFQMMFPAAPASAASAPEGLAARICEVSVLQQTSAGLQPLLTLHTVQALLPEGMTHSEMRCAYAPSLRYLVSLCTCSRLWDRAGSVALRAGCGFDRQHVEAAAAGAEA